MNATVVQRFILFFSPTLEFKDLMQIYVVLTLFGVGMIGEAFSPFLDGVDLIKQVDGG